MIHKYVAPAMLGCGCAIAVILLTACLSPSGPKKPSNARPDVCFWLAMLVGFVLILIRRR